VIKEHIIFFRANKYWHNWQSEFRKGTYRIEILIKGGDDKQIVSMYEDVKKY
jgi:hypothetical protein